MRFSHHSGGAAANHSQTERVNLPRDVCSLSLTRAHVGTSPLTPERI